MKYSVCIDAVFMNKGSFADAMKKVKEAGYQAIEFWTWWDKDIEEIQRLQKELGLEVATFCTKFVNPGDKEFQEEYLQGLKESIVVMKKLNCSTLIAQAGWEFDSFSKEITKKQHRETFLDTMRKAAEMAEKEKITLVIEPLNLLVNHPGYHLSTSEDAFDVIDRIGSSNVKILFDIYHQQITEGNLIQNITGNINKIGHFHAAGNPGRNEITKGEINYRNVFEAIGRTGYEGYIGLEYMTDDNPVAGLIEAKNKILI
ncbi:hydroxypyruvate isomerase family protein [Anaerobium acetethylicum]|uniref:Hydroxypyruvate isomerase n=1 Tax=Anaerobium acetethylicum TaxID=1619234 RepID=A0A1D3TWB7_9FIRM|nr:TIM barrel protein [Anaerobium acetethylicum]SCP98528.1 hydroxypyruvate isomerase [Anaerobium acetethylicum]